MIFQLENGGDVDVVDFINSILIQHPDTKIYVGCDSQNKKKACLYATVIAFRFTYGDEGIRKGARYIYLKEWVDKIMPKLGEDNRRAREIRLWGELTRSVELAQWLEQQGFKIHKIDLDFNLDERWGSNSLSASGRGYCAQFGFDATCKPEEQTASRAGDHIVKKRKGRRWHRKKKKENV